MDIVIAITQRKRRVLSSYRALLRIACQWPRHKFDATSTDHTLHDYMVYTVKKEFRTSKYIANPGLIQEKLAKAEHSIKLLNILKSGSMFNAFPLKRNYAKPKKSVRETSS
jgi:hypothetical protein